MSLEFRVLGPLTVLRDGAAVDLGSPKQRMVLAVLLTNRGRVVPTDRLVDAVWGEDAPPSAVPSLQVYVSNLRRLLRGPNGAISPLVRQAPGYLLDTAEATVDLDDYLTAAGEVRVAAGRGDWRTAVAEAERARSFWRGPLLADLADEPWVRTEAVALDEQRTECRMAEVTALAGSGRAADALAQARLLVADHPFREDVCRLMMRVLARAGRATEALDLHREYVARLRDELGLDPGHGLRDLQRAVLRHDPSLLRWPDAGGAAGTEPERTAGPRPTSAPETPAAVVEVPQTVGERLVGRASQLATLDGVLAESAAGQVRWLTLTGPAGIGKTRLAQEATDRSRRRGGRVVWGRCLEEEGAPAWWPLRQLVRGLDAEPDEVLQAPEGSDADVARFLVYERLESLFRAAAEAGPLILVLDDLQWADPTSLAALSSLAVTLRDVAVAFILTLREGEVREGPAAERVRRTLATLTRSAQAREVAVGPLASAEVAQIVSVIAGEDVAADEAERLASRTGGNALFVCEYARLPRADRLAGAMPTAVRAVLGRRLAGLEPAVLQVIRCAAVMGDRLDLDLLSGVTGLDRFTLADLLDDAADEAIIRPAPGGMGGYAFAHALLRDEVLAGISTIRLQRLHAQVAEALRGRPADQLARRAHHLLAALPLVDAEEALEACRAAASYAEDQWSSETAAGWWEAAIGVFDRLPPGTPTTARP